MSIAKTANQIWEDFSGKEGSQHIATKTAVRGLIRWLKLEKPVKILEIGAGIGTLTYATIQTLESASLQGDSYQIVCIEDNEFCLDQLRKNLGAFFDRVTVFPNINDIPENLRNFDFVITDGGSQEDSSLFSRLSHNAMIFIEGGRLKQSQTLETAINPTPFIKANIKTLKIKESVSDKIKWEKGYRVYKLSPSFFHKIIFSYLDYESRLVARLREKSFVQSFSKSTITAFISFGSLGIL